MRVPATAGVAFGRYQHMLAQSSQMTATKRTPIRRRLAVGRAAHRPPWGAWKAGHRPIVAPLAGTVAATVAAGVAVGVGIALARSQRERRRQGQLAQERQLGLAPGEQLGPGLRRMALSQIDLALELLGAGDCGAHRHGQPPDEQAVHDTRKAIKRLRALLRLLEHELGPRSFQREDAALRHIARQLSTARDATVMLSTLDALIARHPRTLARRRSVLALRQRVSQHSRRMQQLTLAHPATREEVLGELRALRYRVSAWALPSGHSMQLVHADLTRLYRQGRARHARLARGRGKRTRAMHRWRKRVKDLRYAAEMLQRRQPPASPGTPRSSNPPAASKRLRKLARRADQLGELLGQEHDLAVLEQHLRAAAAGNHRHQLWRTSPRARKQLLEHIAKRRRKLRKRALRQGRKLYAHKPKRFVKRVRAAHRALS
jgi:CHAD domain-containing protein